MENYEELEGREVIYRFSNGREFNCKVSAIDKDLGLSIQDIETGRYKMCLNGPSSPLYQKIDAPGEFEEEFELVVEMIKNGVIEIREFVKVANRYHPDMIGKSISARQDICAFSQ